MANESTQPGQIPTRVSAFPKLIGIYAQGVQAIFQQGNDKQLNSHIGLPKETISKLVDRPIAIKKIFQPLSTFGGFPQETNQQFYQRVSEFISHKQRAITPRDYERLILASFPDIYRVKCIPHTNINDEFKPGYLTIAIIPKKNPNSFNLLQPMVRVATLERIKSFFKDKTSLSIQHRERSIPSEEKISIVNPNYESIQVSCWIKFRQNLDEEYHRFKLNDDLKNFLAPWAYEEDYDISFGVRLKQSDILNFIEELPYIDYIGDLKLIQYYKKNNIAQFKLVDPEEDLTSVSYRGVFTSMSKILPSLDLEHDINVINADSKTVGSSFFNDILTVLESTQV